MIFSGIRSRLVALVLVAGIPVAIIAGANAWQKYEQSLTAIAERATVIGEADAVRHALALNDLENLVRGLARFQNFASLSPVDCSRILGRMRGLFDGRYTDLWFLDPDGRLLCNSHGTQGSETANAGFLARLRQERSYILGKFVLDPGSGRVELPAAAPLLEGDAVIAVAGASIRADWFTAENREDATRHHTWLLDSAHRPYPPQDERQAALLPEATLMAALSEAPGRYTRVGASSVGGDFAYSISAPDRGMRVLVGVPAAEARREARNQLITRLTELTFFLLTCLFIVLAGTELSCARPLRRLAHTVRAWKPETTFAPPTTAWDPAEVSDVGSALASASRAIARREADLRKALSQRDRLLSEIHHRVKNNLQIVASLLNMQCDRIGDSEMRAEFETARDRVQALATLHRYLDTEGAGTVVPVAPLLRELASQVVAGSDTVVEAENVILPAEQATSLALLVTEALLNVSRHAFPEGESGRVTITLRRKAGQAVLEVRDDGRGLPDGREEGMGLSLIRGFAAHLGGTSQLEQCDGTVLRVEFPLPGPAMGEAA
ncbi:histidine kinase dimerization/phosphoacceptor domain -containing protein [Sabulicella glaciei]|uniref:histidine kinase n=1 Tax=Sabulicella glaciei TaxID=2984948 RepID=A0ABT3NYJ0_9PROT|nr:histidine kinase dimerization/phosphoacceptor domain -containing protein [Roseococcus sp. MDT2-1-1]MCW8087193.1 ATP-binding protein [Roseococcus sp. MDT2-1-1]